MKMISKVMVFTGCYLPGFKGGGPIRSIANLVDALGDDCSFSIITSDRDLGSIIPYPSVPRNKWVEVGKCKVLYVHKGFLGIKNITQALIKEKYTTVSLNSLFSVRFSIVPLILCKILQKDCRIIVGPRGELSSGALGIKRCKKEIYIEVAKIFGLYKDITWHASSDHEASDIRRKFGDNVNVRVAINISNPSNDFTPSPRIEKSPLRVIFLSRISPMKNLAGSIEIMRRVRKEVIFEVYGPIEDKSYWSECISAAAKLPENIKFNYCGALPPGEVAEKISQYDLFLLPTFGENYGHVIAEALSSGVPVVISNTTPWRNLSKNSIGWDIPLDQPEKFAELIEECCEKSSEEYSMWRNKIRAWAVENIGSKEAIEQNRQLYINFN